MLSYVTPRESSNKKKIGMIYCTIMPKNSRLMSRLTSLAFPKSSFHFPLRTSHFSSASTPACVLKLSSWCGLLLFNAVRRAQLRLRLLDLPPRHVRAAFGEDLHVNPVDPSKDALIVPIPVFTLRQPARRFELICSCCQLVTSERLFIFPYNKLHPSHSISQSSCVLQTSHSFSHYHSGLNHVTSSGWTTRQLDGTLPRELDHRNTYIRCLHNFLRDALSTMPPSARWLPWSGRSEDIRVLARPPLLERHLA